MVCGHVARQEIPGTLRGKEYFRYASSSIGKQPIHAGEVHEIQLIGLLAERPETCGPWPKLQPNPEVHSEEFHCARGRTQLMVSRMCLKRKSKCHQGTGVEFQRSEIFFTGHLRHAPDKDNWC